jgi:hypothetical protein
MNENLIRVQEEIDLGKAGIVQPCRERIRKCLVAPCHQGSLHRRTQGLCWLSDNHLVFKGKRASYQGHRADAVTRAAYACPLACCRQLFRVRAI